MEPTGVLVLDDVGLADFCTFGDALEFSTVVEWALELELAPDENMPHPKSNLAVFGALDDVLELKDECLAGLLSSFSCLSAFCAMCTSSTTLL